MAVDVEWPSRRVGVYHFMTRPGKPGRARRLGGHSEDSYIQGYMLMLLLVFSQCGWTYVIVKI